MQTETTTVDDTCLECDEQAQGHCDDCRRCHVCCRCGGGEG
ncbi:MAG: hypothetical protein WD066_08500 [Planctomycetaceae bacterium]